MGVEELASLISTHTPRAGSDTASPTRRLPPGRFQPTLPVRGVTMCLFVYDEAIKISTHTPRAGSDKCRSTSTSTGRISTHTPRAGSDASAACTPT